ncbi:MAG: type II toxin-antitoxin system VapC family toxin [Rhodospirillales bacterium]|nr:type II toxin-antitoxin system VapC family toxin [Rhodospirillales bacterium]
MTGLVIDASVAIKWAVPETGSEQAVALRRHELAAPELLIAECANVLWKKVKRGQITRDEALLAARPLATVDVELVAMRAAFESALRWACTLDHPAYDCAYLALAEARDHPLVTADAALQRKVSALSAGAGRVRVVHLLDIGKNGEIRT